MGKARAIQGFPNGFHLTVYHPAGSDHPRPRPSLTDRRLGDEL